MRKFSLNERFPAESKPQPLVGRPLLKPYRIRRLLRGALF
jgi:hypothetical protein